MLMYVVFLVSTVELKKQSSCSVQLANKSDQYVAFKVGSFFFFKLHVSWYYFLIKENLPIITCLKKIFSFNKLLTEEWHYCQVKTTSPKKYCVRPNIGIIKPKATCDFTGTSIVPAFHHVLLNLIWINTMIEMLCQS